MVASARAARGIIPARITGWIAPVALALFAFSVRVGLVWRTGFDGLYGQDPFAYFDYAGALKSAIAQGQFPPPFFWPVGYPALAAALSTLLPLSVAAQLVSIVSGALVAVLTFLIVHEILGEERGSMVAGLFAGAVVAGAGQLLISSVSTMSDAAGLFAATLSALGVIRYWSTGRSAWPALAGFALGWAIIIRWVYALLIPVWGAALLLENRKPRGWVSAVFLAIAFGLLALLPQVLLVNEYASRGVTAYVGDAQVYSWNPLNAIRSDIVNADGHFTYPWSVGSYYTLPLINPDYVPVWFTPLVLLGFWGLRRRRSELVLLLGWFIAMWGFLIGTEWENWRFPLAFFPPLAALAGVGLRGLLEQSPTRPARLVGSWLGIGLVVMVAWGLRDAESFIAHQLDDRGIVSWVDAQVPPGGTILTFGMTATLEHFTSFRVVELATESPDSVEQIARRGKDVFVLLDIVNVESQWQGLAPQVDWRALQEHFVITSVASRGGYVLYSVGNER